MVNRRTFLPRDKNQDCHANCIDVVGHQNEIQLIGAGRCWYLRAVWHKKLAITHKERHKLGVKQRGDLMHWHDRVDSRNFLVVVNIDRGIKLVFLKGSHKHEQDIGNYDSKPSVKLNTTPSNDGRVSNVWLPIWCISKVVVGCDRENQKGVPKHPYEGYEVLEQLRFEARGVVEPTRYHQKGVCKHHLNPHPSKNVL